VLIADEPTANLDSGLSVAFMEIVASLKAAGKTLLLASHDPLVCQAGAVDRVVSMRDGRIEAAAP
jgi:putative ABC transport system ATP-binding protein